MRLVAPFQPAHLSLREIAGVGISIRREDAQSVVDIDHPNAIRALRRFGFAESTAPTDPAIALRAWAEDVVKGTGIAVREAARFTDDVAKVEALLTAEVAGPNRVSVVELLTRRVRGMRAQNTST